MFDYDKFEALVESTGITKKYIADALGRKPSIFSSWRTGKSKPSDEQLAIVAQILHTTPAYLRGETDEKNPAAQSDGNKSVSTYDEIDAYMLASFRQLNVENKIEVLNKLLDRLRSQQAQDAE